MDWLTTPMLLAAAVPPDKQLVSAAVRIAAIALAFGLVVFVHELGHFLMARFSGMAVYEFSLGFGRPLLAWFKRKDTQYSFRFWPFLSYVRIAGMEPEDDHPQGYDKKPRWAQALVLVMGCLMNFALAVGLFIAMGLIFGKGVPTNAIAEVIDKTPAAQVGLKVGDRIVGLDGQALPLDRLRARIQESPGKRITLEVERGHQRLAVPIVPSRQIDLEVRGISIVEKPVGRIGIGFAVKLQPAGVLESIGAGFTDTYDLLRVQLAGLVSMLTRQIKPEVMGPVGIVQQLYTQAQEDWLRFLHMVALLTVAVGFLNLLPIPPLDGSRLVILAYEGLRGKPVDKEKERLVHLVGLAAFLIFILFITYKDIVRIVVSKGG
jgi:regulator of sigma E protease